jgi:ketosteroid isomerase-like protein
VVATVATRRKSPIFETPDIGPKPLPCVATSCRFGAHGKERVCHRLPPVARAADAFSRGDPEPVKELYSEADDVTLANPFGPARRGREAVMGALDYASSQMSDGQVVGFDELARYKSDELATILEVEHWRARIGDRDSVEPFDLRVTRTFRSENGEWKIVHRHADPISTEDESGPLRAS